MTPFALFITFSLHFQRFLDRESNVCGVPCLLTTLDVLSLPSSLFFPRFREQESDVQVVHRAATNFKKAITIKERRAVPDNPWASVDAQGLYNTTPNCAFERCDLFNH
jgi:hypothetical protein